MNRPRQLAKLAAMREHAKADTTEGANAARLAARFADLHQITDAEFEQSMSATTSDEPPS